MDRVGRQFEFDRETLAASHDIQFEDLARFSVVQRQEPVDAVANGLAVDGLDEIAAFELRVLGRAFGFDPDNCRQWAEGVDLDAGPRIELPVSEPMPATPKLAATPEAVPPLEPAGTLDGS